MRRQDDHAGVAHADAHHQHEVGGMVVVQWGLGLQFVAIVAGRLVAVVAVGDEDRAWCPSGPVTWASRSTSVTGQIRWTTPR